MGEFFLDIGTTASLAQFFKGPKNIIKVSKEKYPFGLNSYCCSATEAQTPTTSSRTVKGPLTIS